ncbi:nicotinamide-nucleotide amidohydrolase family protein [bacterium]|nr:nicotinamide-nucleotide amidohydrolase family protein [bacterium]
MKIETIAIGDELLTGRTADTNSAYVAGELFSRGARLERTQTVLDDAADIVSAIKRSSESADFVVCFGGLGPTSDDKTAAVIAQLLGTSLVQDSFSLKRLEEYALKRKRVITEPMLKQVLYPQGTQPLPNLVGMAPGFACQIGQAHFFFLPGVPSEMKGMFADSVLPKIEAALRKSGTERLFTSSWKLIGIPESELQRRMDAIESELPKNAWLGYRTRYPENHLTLYWRALEDPGAAKHAFVERVRGLVKDFCYTETDVEIENLVLERLKSQGLHLALAESCTGGLTAQRLTKVSGSSEAFWGSAVVYQVAAKGVLLGVHLPNEQAAVSAEASMLLAEALKAKSGAAVCAAVTGYSGPGGGTESDPVGTFYLHLITPRAAIARRISHPGLNREANQWGAATYLLCEIYAALNEEK